MIELQVAGISSDVIDILEKQGLPVRRQMNIDLPELPEDITLVDDGELMDMAVKFMENYNFLLTQVACAELAINEQDNDLDFNEAQLLISLTEAFPKTSATLIKAMITTNDDIKKLRDEMLQAKAYHKLLKAMLDNAERSYQLTSRELTRRTSVLKSRGY
jgi:hypothetical protein